MSLRAHDREGRKGAGGIRQRHGAGKVPGQRLQANQAQGIFSLILDKQFTPALALSTWACCEVRALGSGKRQTGSGKHRNCHQRDATRDTEGEGH